MKVYIFGTGRYYQMYKNYFERVDVIGLLDNSKDKIGSIIDGYVVERFDTKSLKEFDYIYILIRKYVLVKEALIQLGVPEDKIRSWRSDLVKLKYDDGMCKKYYSNISNFRKQKKVLLISHELSYSGAPLALLSLGQVFLKHGYHVVIASPVDNKNFREYIMTLGIDVVIDGNLTIGHLSDIQWARAFSYVVVNTVLLYYLLASIHTKQTVVWWLHEYAQTYDVMIENIGVDRFIVDKILFNCIKIYSVGDVAERCFRTIYKFGNVKELLYGIEDFFVSRNVIKNEKIIAVIGSNLYAKGIDLFVEIAEYWKKQKSSGVRFVAVVSNAESVQLEFDNKYSGKCNVQFIENMEHNLLKSFYREIFALLVPSRMDVMPIVAAEAFMNHIPVMISSVAGTAHYIEDGFNGFVCESGNLQEWTDKLQYLLDNSDKAEQIGHEGRLIYENVFSMDVFEKNVLKIFDN